MRALAAGLLCLGTLLPHGVAAQRPLLIRQAQLIDGTGAPRRVGSVRVVGDRIVAVGAVRAEPGDSVIDAHGLVLAPGFIDSHSHHGSELFRPDSLRRAGLAMVSQGVTTIVVGQDGSGMGLRARFDTLTTRPVAVNVASYVGHGSVRRVVLGPNFARAATAAEQARMAAIVRDEMAAGALGLSTGLEYDPGIYATPDEVLTLAKLVAKVGGRYISHIRSEDRDFWPALREVITIGRVTGMPVQVSHIKLGMRDLWGQASRVLATLNEARRAGIRITADIYPYLYWHSNLGVFYPRRNFADSAETAFILAHVSGAEDIILSEPDGHPEYRGQTVAQLAAARGKSPVRTMLSLLAEPGGRDYGVVAKGMDARDMEQLLQWPFTNVCSDGASTGLHPRGFGSFAQVLGPFVRDRKLFTLEEAVRKMTTLSATNLGLRQRGRLAPGYFADLVLFDPATITDHATFETPQALATGVASVWVNGALVFQQGQVTGQFPGRPIRRGTSR